MGPNSGEPGLKRGWIQPARLKYILQVLERSPALKVKTAETLRSIIKDTRALELFMNAGVPNQLGFIGELGERLQVRCLPQAPRDRDLVAVFSETFRFESDAKWILNISAETFQGWLELFRQSPENPMIQDAKDALYLLSRNVQTIGLSRLVRNRVSQPDFRQLPFFELPEMTEKFLNNPAGLTYGAFTETLDRCLAILAEVHDHFRSHGVSISLVYQIERLKALIRRCQVLGRLLASGAGDCKLIQEFFARLVRENIRARKPGTLFKDNLVLLCQNIVQTNAEIGEHYITRNRRDYLKILKKSWGGGALTGFTTLFKFLLSHLHMAPLISGALAAANYSISFLGLQILGFTLATKQPAMTATALASTLEKVGEKTAETELDPLIVEVVHLIRSQIAAVIGNLSMVVPVVILLDLCFFGMGAHLTDPDHARHAIRSFSILGMTPIDAAFTGVLLWVSSVFAGAFENWVNFRRLPEAIEHHPRLRIVFGEHRARRLGAFLNQHAAGVAACISLAILLGVTPALAQFVGLPLDVRHVTLSSGTLAASAMSIGPAVFSNWEFWLAVLGIISMAILNLVVPFALALSVAMWATQASAPRREIIYRALFKKLIREPWAFIYLV